MKSMKQFLLLGILAFAVFAIPASVFANKTIFLATLTTGAELHTVVGSTARGNAVLAAFPDGIHFQAVVYNLSGNPTGAHLHGPATAQQNGGIVVPLCGAPQPAVLTECTMQNGALKIQGVITSQLVGMTPAEFISALNNGLLYINVHTELNPAGEARGQVIPR